MIASIDILRHELVPRFRILTEEEKKQVLERFNTTEKKLPRILADDPAVKVLKAKHGDLLEINRNSRIAGESVYYRIVV